MKPISAGLTTSSQPTMAISDENATHDHDEREPPHQAFISSS
jgi:hypothetical protein